MLPPSEARTPRLVTSVMSGAVTWTTSAPARPETASLATSVTTASPSAPGVEDRERPVHLEPELSHRPDRVLLLHLGHRDPRGRALGRIIQHGRVHARRARRRTARPARAPRTARALRGARSGLPRRRAAAPRWVRRRRSARRWCAGPGLLVRRVFCPACWCSSHSVRRDGGLPCTAWYSRASRSSSPVTATARELNRSITSWLTPPTSAPLPSARGTIA